MFRNKGSWYKLLREALLPFVRVWNRSRLFLVFLSGEDGRDNRPHKYRLAELIVGFRGSENTSKTMFFTQIPLLVRLIEVFVINYRVHLRRTNKHTHTHRQTNAIDFSNVSTEGALRAINRFVTYQTTPPPNENKIYGVCVCDYFVIIIDVIRNM